jgi:hypothetical protein
MKERGGGAGEKMREDMREVSPNLFYLLTVNTHREPQRGPLQTTIAAPSLHP